jgi:hypothetical protein
MNALTKKSGSDSQRRGSQILHAIRLQQATEKAITFENQFSPSAKTTASAALRATNLSKIGHSIVDQEMGKYKIGRKKKSILDFSPRKLYNRSALACSPKPTLAASPSFGFRQ